MNYQIKIINPLNDNRWDEFVWHHPHGMLYHHSVWGQVISETFGYKPLYIALENKKTLQFDGIIPLMQINSYLTGKRMISLPLTSYCPLLIPDEALRNVIQYLKNQQFIFDHIQLKYSEELKNNYSFLSKQSFHTTHVLSLNGDLDKIFKSFHNTSVRQRIKKAEKSELKFRLGDKEEDLKNFYKLQIKVRKKHGLPPHPYSFYYNMWRLLKAKNFIILPVIEYKNKVIAASITLKYKDTFYYEYSAADSQYFKLNPNQKLIWEIIKIAHGEGAKKFDFGRSSNNNRSLIKFKERWATKASPLNYYYYPRLKNALADNENKPLHKFVNFVNRYIPSPLLRLEGKFLYQHIG